MEIRYVKADPTGNITALVENSPPRSDVAKAVFAAGSEIEQLGFLGESEGCDIALTMAGGEFCGNACLSAAAYHLRRMGRADGRILVAISGAEAPVEVEMTALGNDEFVGSLNMPLPLAVESVDTAFGTVPVVRFPGISHLILTHSVSDTEAEELIRPLCVALGTDALGLMLYDSGKVSLRPLVYVPGANSLFWERSCASGTSAIGAWLAVGSGRDVSLALSQPGGTLSIDACLGSSGLSRLRLSGRVRLGAGECIKI